MRIRAQASDTSGQASSPQETTSSPAGISTALQTGTLEPRRETGSTSTSTPPRMSIADLAVVTDPLLQFVLPLQRQQITQDALRQGGISGEVRTVQSMTPRELADAMRSAVRTGDFERMPQEAREAFVHEVLDRLVQLPVPEGEKILDVLLGCGAFDTQLRQADGQGRAPAVLRQHALPLLRHFEGELARREQANEQFGTPWENLVLPLLVESQNALRPGLDLRIATPKQLGQQVVEAVKANKATDSIVILDDQILAHRAAAHVVTDPQVPPRIAILDSFEDPRHLANQMLGKMGKLAKHSFVQPVHLETQNAYSCNIFALSAAKKIADHRDSVHTMYEPMTNPPQGTRRAVGLQPTLKGTQTSLPPAFFKHSDSRKTLERLEASSAERGIELSETPVNKRGGTGENILERWDRHSVIRPHETEDRMVTYSASVEEKRRDFVAKAVKHFL
jgi:hypothetical protein